MEIEKLKKIIYGNKNVSVQHLKQFSTKLTEETTNTSVVSDLPKLIPVVFKYAVHEDKKFRESALPALIELAGLLDLNKHLKEKPWWAEMKGEILKSVDVLMNLVSTGDDQWATLWMTTVMMLGSDLRSELTLLNRLLKVVEKAFKMNDEEVRHQGFECWCKLIDNFSINKQEINNKRRLALLVIPLKANNHNTPRLCASKMKTWKHLLSKLDQHSEMTVQLLVTHFLEFMFCGVGSIAPACKTLNADCANVFAQMLQTPLLFRILPKLFIQHAFVCIEHVHRDLPLCISILEGLLDNMKSNQWTEAHVSELMVNFFNASKSEKLGKSKTFAHMIRTLSSGNHTLPNDTLVKHMKTVLSLALEPDVLVNYTEAWCNELLNIVAETDPIQLPQNIIGDIITKLNVLAVSELFRDEKVKFLRGMWMTMTNIICKWMADDGTIGKNGNEENDLQNIHQLLVFGAAPLSSTWNKLQMKSWKSLYSECVKYFSLSTELKCERFVSDLMELLLEGVKDKKIPLHVALDLVSIILEFHLSKDESSILPLMMEVAVSTINSFQNDTTGTSALLNQYLKILLVAARNEPALVNDILTVTDKMLTSLEESPLDYGHLEKTRNAILKVQIQLNALKPCRSQDRSECPGTSNLTPTTSPTMTSFMHRLAKSKETKSKVSSPTPSQSSDVSSSPNHTPNSKKVSSPFCDMKSEHFVFVPPKPRKILLTDHQKENLTKRKHDIPALYQDLSQDSSQSPFESIITPTQGVDKEQNMEKGTTLHSPQNFKEVNFRSLSPKKSVVSNLSSSTLEDKLQNNKENDCVNNNKKSPIKSNAKEIQISEVAEDALKVLQEDQKRIQEHGPENVEISKAIPANTRLRSKKSSACDSSGNLSLTDAKENTKTAFSDLHNHDEGKESGCNKTTKDEALNKDDKSIDQTNQNENHNDMEKEIKDTAHDVTTPRNSSIEVKTPKRSLRKNKLSISVEKSAKKNNQRNKQEEQNEKDKSNLSLPGSGLKSSSSTTTPKVSPRRLRKRKSGVTPILSGGNIIKKKRKSQSPFNSKDSPTNKSVVNNETPTNTKPENVCKNDSLDSNDEFKQSIKQTDEKEENKKDFDKSNLRSGSDKRKSASKSEVEQIKCTTSTHTKEIVTKSTINISENKSKVAPGNKDDEIEVVAIVEVQDENKLSSDIEVENKKDLKIVDNECKLHSSKSLLSLKDSIPFIDISCSPVKVVVERLPDIIISANQFEIQEKTELSCKSTKKVDRKKESPVRNITESLFASNHDINSNNVNASSNVQSANSDGKVVVSEGKSITLNMLNASSLKDETCNNKKNNNSRGDLNNSNNTNNEESKPSENEGSENKQIENENRLVEKVNSEYTDTSSSRRIKISMDITETSLHSEKCIREVNSKRLVDNGKYLVHYKNKEQKSTDIKSTLDTNYVDSGKYLVNENKEQDSTDIKTTPVKKTSSSESITLPSVSASKLTETSNSIISSPKPKSAENTPVKSGQKQLKQTQLPFTPIRKKIVTSKSDSCLEPESSEEQNSISKSDEKEDKSPFLVLVKMGTPEIKKALYSPKSKSENTIDGPEPTLYSHRTDNELNQEKPPKACVKRSLSGNKSETRQEVQRTPEKANSSNTMVVCLERSEVEVVEKTNIESPREMIESEDIIASSQETDVTTQSILLSYRNSCSDQSLKFLSKSPKKCENPPQVINSSERVLRSSPSKTESSRFTGTPVKKSVCRRLDVEIEESPDFNEVDSLPTSTEEKSVTNKNTEELSSDFKLLNGDSEINKNNENSYPSSRVSEIINNIENQNMSSDCSPRSHKNLKRFVVETDASSVGSPKRTMGSLRLENNGSPVASPNSRTSQMMELAKQETERTISSPSSANKRRVLPVRVGPVTRAPKRHIIQRTHSGPSEEWVRRTYSPMASPNSSILKRTLQPISPDCSPPSSKKKRVSFLDPPVSESLLFSKANPGKGQIQRPEPKLDTDSEELPTQGSVGLEMAETSTSEAKVFSPLKQCSSPLADIMERIVNLQWMSELEAQLKKLGVTTVGELSSLPEETVQRLPFIPPKLERLRKILQNYYNEINEKTDDARPICPEISKDECLTPEKESPEVLIKSPEQTVEDLQPQSQETTCLESSDEDISSVAENIKNKIEQCPELLSELGNKLHIDIVMKLLDFAVCKLKTENEKS